ncbi:MAG: hypothetical protein WC455_11960 [Dehalococcoidia bacterium]|jgi:hypothetical protein
MVNNDRAPTGPRVLALEAARAVRIRHDDGTWTNYTPTADTDLARGACLEAALAAVASCESIFIAPGRFRGDFTIPETLNAISIFGSGRDSTVLLPDTNVLRGTAVLTITQDVGGVSHIIKDFTLGQDSGTPFRACACLKTDVTPANTAYGLIVRAENIKYSWKHGAAVIGGAIDQVNPEIYAYKDLDTDPPLYAKTILSGEEAVNLWSGGAGYSAALSYSCPKWNTGHKISVPDTATTDAYKFTPASFPSVPVTADAIKLFMYVGACSGLKDGDWELQVQTSDNTKIGDSIPLPSLTPSYDTTWVPLILAWTGTKTGTAHHLALVKVRSWANPAFAIGFNDLQMIDTTRADNDQIFYDGWDPTQVKPKVMTEDSSDPTVLYGTGSKGLWGGRWTGGTALMAGVGAVPNTALPRFTVGIVHIAPLPGLGTLQWTNPIVEIRCRDNGCGEVFKALGHSSAESNMAIVGAQIYPEMGGSTAEFWYMQTLFGSISAQGIDMSTVNAEYLAQVHPVRQLHANVMWNGKVYNSNDLDIGRYWGHRTGLNNRVLDLESGMSKQQDDTIKAWLTENPRRIITPVLDAKGAATWRYINVVYLTTRAIKIKAARIVYTQATNTASGAIICIGKPGVSDTYYANNTALENAKGIGDSTAIALLNEIVSDGSTVVVEFRPSASTVTGKFYVELDFDYVTPSAILGVPTITVTGDGEDDKNVVVQLKDEFANDVIDGIYPVDLWLSDTAGGAEITTAPTSIAINYGIQLKVITADKHWSYLTDVDLIQPGCIDFTITHTDAAAKTLFVNIAAGGKIYSSEAIVFPAA